MGTLKSLRCVNEKILIPQWLWCALSAAEWHIKRALPIQAIYTAKGSAIQIQKPNRAVNM
jgi:hypothetical protein